VQLSLKGPDDIVKIEKVAVIGAGVMGSGIAAHVANAGLPVTLLDIVPKGAENRNIITETAVQKMLKPVRMGSPTPLMHRKNARLITTGNIEDHLDALGDADLIIEVVLEKLEIKHDVFKKIELEATKSGFAGMFFWADFGFITRVRLRDTSVSLSGPLLKQIFWRSWYG